MRRLLCALVSLAAMFALSPLCFGQATSSIIVGTVVDATGATVPNAAVAAKNVDTNVKYTGVANSAGDYRINNVPAGRYNVTVTAKGFTTATMAGVEAQLNHTATVNFTLPVGSVATTVEVTAATAAIDTATAQLQTTTTPGTAVDVPTAGFSKVVNGSGIWNLSLLGAGVASSGGVGQGTGPSIAGQRPENNTFNIDGVINDNHYITGPQVSVPNDAVAEFTLLQNQFSPSSAAHRAACSMSIVKTGTNTIHGSIYEYLQNRNLNAVDANSSAPAGDTPSPATTTTAWAPPSAVPSSRTSCSTSEISSTTRWARQHNPAGRRWTRPPPPASRAAASITGVSTDQSRVFSRSTCPWRQRPTRPIRSPWAASIFPTAPSRSPRRTTTTPTTRWSPIDYNISDKDQIRGRFIYNNIQGHRFVRRHCRCSSSLTRT